MDNKLKDFYKLSDISTSRLEKSEEAAKSLRQIINIVGFCYLITLFYLFNSEINYSALIWCELIVCVCAWICGLTETGNILTGSRFLTREEDYRCYTTSITSISVLLYMLSLNAYINHRGNVLIGVSIYAFTQVLSFLVGYITRKNKRENRLATLNKILQISTIIILIFIALVGVATNDIKITLAFAGTIIICSFLEYTCGIFKCENYYVRKLLKEKKRK